MEKKEPSSTIGNINYQCELGGGTMENSTEVFKKLNSEL